MQIASTSYVSNNPYVGMNLHSKGIMPYNNKTIEDFSDDIQEKTLDYNERAFESLAPNAPDEVKDAWMEAAKETGVNGTGMLQNGMLSHITQMAAQKAVKWYNGEKDYSDILGNSVESAIQKTKEALYELQNPLSPNCNRSIEVQQQIIKEKKFYENFLGKLEKIKIER